MGIGNAVLVLPDGKVLVAGVAEDNNGDFLVQRYKADLTVDSAWADGGRATMDFPLADAGLGQSFFSDEAQAIALDGDKLVLAGGRAGAVSRPRVGAGPLFGRWNA